MRNIRAAVPRYAVTAMKQRMLAFDFGASSGRAILGLWDGERIALQEVHRFTNDPVTVNGTMYWDVLRLLHEIKQGMLAAKEAGGFDSIGIDTWGVDFGLLDADGYLLENPVHYRDARTGGMLDAALERIPARALYEQTGNQFMEINTAFQLLALQKKRPALLASADCALLMPDLLAYFLCGERGSERSIVSTTQLFDPGARDWSCEVADALGIPLLFPGIIEPGTVRGMLSPALQEELGLPAVPVIAVCGHDTQCALTAVPAREDAFLFLSCGTWSLLGTELPEPVLTAQAQACNLTNESGFGGKISFLKNIVGLWMLQESRRQWQREGTRYSFDEMERLARAAEPFACFTNPDDARFTPAGNIPRRVRAYCGDTGQAVPQSNGAVLRCIYESLAMKYRAAAEQITMCTGEWYDTLYMVGGGIQDSLLCQLAADATGCRVAAGPVEATVFGNLAIQLAAAGELHGLCEVRAAVRRSIETREYLPRNAQAWCAAYQKFQEVVPC